MADLEVDLQSVIEKLKFLQVEHGNEIDACDEAEVDIDVGLRSLEDALRTLQKRPEEDNEDRDTQAQHEAMEGRASRFV